MLSQKYDRLREVISAYGSGIVALSGGVDSTLLARAAHDSLGERALAVTGSSVSIPARDLEEARVVASQIGIPHRVIDTDEMADENYRANPANRCYFCKSELYGKLVDLARSEGYSAVFSGDNVDDLKDHRPGRQAALESSVAFPLQEAGLTKEEIRALARELGLPNWDRPASPCLSSRVAYGEPIEPEWLRRIDEAETMIKSLGIRQVRVRHHRNLARIEVEPRDLPVILEAHDRIARHLRGLGWTFVSVDLCGFQSGSLNRVLGQEPA